MGTLHKSSKISLTATLNRIEDHALQIMIQLIERYASAIIEIADWSILIGDLQSPISYTRVRRVTDL